MDALTELRVPPNTPMPLRKSYPLYNTNKEAAPASTDSLLSSDYSNSPLIFGTSLPWALASIELEHRLRAEDDQWNSEGTGSEPSPTDTARTSAMSLLSDELCSIYHVETFVHPTHTVTRAVIRATQPKYHSRFAFLRPSTPAVGRPTSPMPRPVSPLTGALKTLRLITDATLFEEDLDYYEHRWMLEQAGQSQMQISVKKQVQVTVESVRHVVDDEDEVVYPRRRIPSFFGKRRTPTFSHRP
ncbi:hypothetical protein EUX98_g8819 [Antrodiella citrinella]|uniref:Uncharacterized protein n=1 Tax=Antrodiella citrinella TaxID=2447956 RepID=A0A4S4M2V5_9APHY|nr:hypothetical protein EUX98_g8819 [Antrodiella citrinella]